MRHWYHIDTHDPVKRKALTRMLLRQRIQFEARPTRQPPWHICFFVDDDERDDIQRWLDNYQAGK